MDLDFKLEFEDTKEFIKELLYSIKIDNYQLGELILATFNKNDIVDFLKQDDYINKLSNVFKVLPFEIKSVFTIHNIKTLREDILYIKMINLGFNKGQQLGYKVIKFLNEIYSNHSMILLAEPIPIGRNAQFNSKVLATGRRKLIKFYLNNNFNKLKQNVMIKV